MARAILILLQQATGCGLNRASVERYEALQMREISTTGFNEKSVSCGVD